ncbi:response regulator rcp1 [mine drainage metagenome]|uniref:Response regulator rcp1 n=1 Tax=mine drainage metagenome TaxID=410659 RepID=A0A1J5SY77_9ZZZZ
MDNETEIILVEDNPSDADLTIRALKKCNVTNKILHLKDGQEILDYIFADDELKDSDSVRLPKVILLDLKMPKVCGIEVLRKLKADERTKIIPVVVLTSSKEDPDVKECYRLGVNSYVVKPLAFDDFAKAVSQLGLYWLLINQPTK